MKLSLILLSSLLSFPGFQSLKASDEKPDSKTSGQGQLADLSGETSAATMPSKDGTKDVPASDHFARLSPAEMKAVLDEVRKRDLEGIMQAWLDADRKEHDPSKQSALRRIFARALAGRNPLPDYFDQLAEFLGNKSNGMRERAALLSVLAYADTMPAIELLLRAALTLAEPELRERAVVEIKRLGQVPSDGKSFQEQERSFPLERVWAKSRDPKLLFAVGLSIAEIGGSSGMDSLLELAIKEPESADIRTSVAKQALRSAKISNPNSTLSISERLQLELPGSEASAFLSDLLAASMANNAGAALVDWLRNTDDQAAPRARRYAVQTPTVSMYEAWRAALASTVQFLSEKNRDAIRAGLADFDASHKGK